MSRITDLTKNLDKLQRMRLEAALGALVHHEGLINDIAGELGEQPQSLRPVCRILRVIVDGEE